VRRFVVLWVLLAACSSGSKTGTLDAIKKRGELTWGADLQGGEPFVYEDPANPKQVTGFEVDIANAIARRLGVKARFVQYAWSNLVPSLERGDFDIVMNGLESTPERQSRILLSQPYFIYAETLAVRTDSAYATLDDLKGKRVGTLNQTYAHDLLRGLPLEPVLYEGNEEPYIDLEQGRTEAVLLDNIIADRYGCVSSRPKIKCVPGDIARGTYVIGIRRGDETLKAAIDAALGEMRKDGELEQILRKASLWDARQTQPPPLMAAETSVRKRALDGDMLWQFLEAAVVTLKLSLFAFLLAVPVGLLLAVARVYGGGSCASRAAIRAAPSCGRRAGSSERQAAIRAASRGGTSGRRSARLDSRLNRPSSASRASRPQPNTSTR
jgi:polar amino acid transport system substrate-binding protein